MMNHWIERWQNGRIGWHETDGNAGLRAHWRFDAQQVLVPLCGKSPDLRWLAEQGHRVSGRIASNGGGWALTPSAPWQTGRYTLRLDHALEDIAGNRIAAPFDAPPGTMGAVRKAVERLVDIAQPPKTRAQVCRMQCNRSP